MSARGRELLENVRVLKNVKTDENCAPKIALAVLENFQTDGNLADVFQSEPNFSVVKIGVGKSINFAETHNNKFDVVVSDGIFSSFDNSFDEISSLLTEILKILKSAGILLLREDLANSGKNLAQYTDLFDSYRVILNAEGNGHKNLVGFKFHWMKCFRSAISERKNWLDLCWCLEKTVFPQANSDENQFVGKPVSVRDFLDKKQYSNTGIEVYEWIFGEGFISPGGAEQNVKFLEELNLHSGQYLLDIGCGIGGNAFQLAKKYDCKVLGIDLSSNMAAIALERANKEKNEKIEFMIADAMRFDFPENSFNVIYSRDCILHIADKNGLFRRFFKWLKPGGTVFFTDYNVGAKDLTEPFQKYLQDRQYTLKTISQYVTSLEQAGFEDVEGRDMTQKFKEILEEEWKRVEQGKETFVKVFV